MLCADEESKQTYYESYAWVDGPWVMPVPKQRPISRIGLEVNSKRHESWDDRARPAWRDLSSTSNND